MSVAYAQRIDPSATIDPTARIDPTASIGPDCVIETGAIVGPRCVIGAGSRLRPYAVVVQDTEIGAHNDLHPYAVLGGDPQDRAFKPEVPGRLIVGDHNIIREGVTISRGTGDEIPTRIGSHNYFMAASHAGHNVQMGSYCTLANGTLIAGHVRIGDRVTFGGTALVHQFCHIGDLVMFQGGGCASVHVPPFCVIKDINVTAGLNVIGMRRTGVSAEEREQVKRLFRAVCADRTGRPAADRLAEFRSETLGPAAAKFLAFMDEVRTLTGPRARGVCMVAVRRNRIDAED